MATTDTQDEIIDTNEEVVLEDGQPDFLNMSDEELMAFDPSVVTATVTTPAEEEKADEIVDKDKAQDDKAEDGKGAGDEGNAGQEAKTADEVPGADGKKPGDAKAADGKEVVADPAAKANTDKDPKDPADKADTAADQSAVIDYKAEYEKLVAPFKANGRDITVKGVDDAIALMQMGANYNKKMAALKPHMGYLKMLETNGLLDAEKLGFLIDLSKRDPAAINKLVNDSKIDPLDLSAEKANSYKPGNHTVDERELELDAVLNELEGTEHYNRTLEVVSTQWDKASKSVVTQNPQLLTIINGHMQSGIFDLIAAEIDSERVFGRLKGLSDIDAYKQVGDAIDKRGGFAHLTGAAAAAPAQKQAPAAVVIVPPKPSKEEEDKLREKKRAASSTKATVLSSDTKADFNPLGMSDEDFKKFK